jgi:hypothetical protein
MAAARKRAFLKALEATGNVTLAAEAAKVSRSWVGLHRKEHPEFDADCRAAVAAARARLGGHGARRPPSGWGFLDGCELVVRGTNGRRMQIARARLVQITPRTEQRLLQVLAATGNGKAACAAAGVTPGAVWNHRRRWPGFDKMWNEAAIRGAMRIETGVIENGRNLFSEPEHPPELPMPPMTFSQAIHLLHMNKHRLHGIGKAPGKSWRPPPTLAELAPGIWRKFMALEASWAMSAEEKAKDEKEWALRRRSGQARRRGSGRKKGDS